jgi:hypothetical protein
MNVLHGYCSEAPRVFQRRNEYMKRQGYSGLEIVLLASLGSDLLIPVQLACLLL